MRQGLHKVLNIQLLQLPEVRWQGIRRVIAIRDPAPLKRQHIDATACLPKVIQVLIIHPDLINPQLPNPRVICHRLPEHFRRRPINLCNLHRCQRRIRFHNPR